jgi:hypothetical protein
MRTPNDSLDDFKTIDAKPEPEPPALVTVQRTGEVEVLKPLASWEDFAKTKTARRETARGWHRLTAFHRSLATAGAVALIALAIGGGVYIRNYRSHVGSAQIPADNVVISNSSATNQRSANALPSVEEPLTSDLFPSEDSPSASDDDEANVVRSVAKRRHVARRHVLRAAYRPLLRPFRPRFGLPRPQFWVSNFAPTTLIIYVENGVIKTRIEPWLNAGYKKPASFSN